MFGLKLDNSKSECFIAEPWTQNLDDNISQLQGEFHKPAQNASAGCCCCLEPLLSSPRFSKYRRRVDWMSFTIVSVRVTQQRSRYLCPELAIVERKVMAKNNKEKLRRGAKDNNGFGGRKKCESKRGREKEWIGLSLSLLLSHTHSLTQTLTLALFFMLSHSHSLLLSFTYTVSFTLSLSYIQTHSLSSNSHSHALSSSLAVNIWSLCAVIIRNTFSKKQNTKDRSLDEKDQT